MNAGRPNPAALERAASQLDDVARRLESAAARAQAQQRSVAPIAQGVQQLVGGSASGRDKRIATHLAALAKDVTTTATAAHDAATQARKAAEQARADAQRERQAQQDEKNRARR